MSDYLPEELLVQIFVRLPAKSLVRFRSVCRSWSLLIISPKFILSHVQYNHAIGNHNFLLRWFCNTQEKEIYTLHDENNNFKAIRKLGFPFDKPLWDFFAVVGCVNGLICLWDDTHELNPVTLWNPAIQKAFRVPDLHFAGSNNGSWSFQKSTFGFGFNAVANDYKILRITFFFTHSIKSRRINRRPLSFLSQPVVCSADIFSLNSKSWRCISNSVPLQQLSIPFFLNGDLHFLTRKDGNQCAIVSFSLNAETFAEIPCPRDAKLDMHLDHQIVASSETISLLDQVFQHRYDIWVMKVYKVEESWTRVVSIQLDMICGWKRILGFSSNGGLILVGSGIWVGYPTLEDVKVVDIEPSGSCCAPYGEHYTESLVLLGEGSSVPLVQHMEEGDDKRGHDGRGYEIRRVAGKRRGKRARLSLNL